MFLCLRILKVHRIFPGWADTFSVRSQARRQNCDQYIAPKQSEPSCKNQGHVEEHRQKLFIDVDNFEMDAEIW